MFAEKCRLYAHNRVALRLSDFQASVQTEQAQHLQLADLIHIHIPTESTIIITEVQVHQEFLRNRHVNVISILAQVLPQYQVRSSCQCSTVVLYPSVSLTLFFMYYKNK